MLTKKQKEEIAFYLLNCKIVYGSQAMIDKKSSNVSRLRKLLEFCDFEKVNWKNLEMNVLDFSSQKLPLSVSDFIDIVNKLFTRWR